MQRVAPAASCLTNAGEVQSHAVYPPNSSIFSFTVALIASRRSHPATRRMSVARDLLGPDARRRLCVGMAANMIGVLKRIIAVRPRTGIWCCSTVIRRKNPASTKPRRAISLGGGDRKQKRYQSIRGAVSDHGRQTAHQDLYRLDGADHQHEIDHCDGILI